MLSGTRWLLVASLPLSLAKKLKANQSQQYNVLTASVSLLTVVLNSRLSSSNAGLETQRQKGLALPGLFLFYESENSKTS